jgi:hypothetical protein
MRYSSMRWKKESVAPCRPGDSKPGERFSRVRR